MQINLEKKKSSAACRAITLVKTRVISKLFPLLTLGTFFASSQESCFSQLHPTTLLPTNQKTTKSNHYLIYISNVQQSYLFFCILLSLSICYYILLSIQGSDSSHIPSFSVWISLSFPDFIFLKACVSFQHHWLIDMLVLLLPLQFARTLTRVVKNDHYCLYLYSIWLFPMCWLQRLR